MSDLLSSLCMPSVPWHFFCVQQAVPLCRPHATFDCDGSFCDESFLVHPQCPHERTSRCNKHIDAANFLLGNFISSGSWQVDLEMLVSDILKCLVLDNDRVKKLHHSLPQFKTKEAVKMSANSSQRSYCRRQHQVVPNLGVACLESLETMTTPGQSLVLSCSFVVQEWLDDSVLVERVRDPLILPLLRGLCSFVGGVGKALSRCSRSSLPLPYSGSGWWRC